MALAREEMDEAMWACSHEPINTERYRAGLKVLKEMARRRNLRLGIQNTNQAGSPGDG
jgi:hypothetical protein